jgi:hypothetical protein
MLFMMHTLYILYKEQSLYKGTLNYFLDLLPLFVIQLWIKRKFLYAGTL